ncbi:MAG: hypothetical protein KJO27_01940 [Gammaproteobacteria bacterium]|nr:hypothetical protein [Gammaproteobacteria bacterium]NNL44164.1 hypothetical protein [Woeseiaceae bacterium]
MNTRLYMLVGIGAGLLAGCGGSGGDANGGLSASQDSNTSPGGTGNTPGSSSLQASPGGFWEGIDSDGGSINLLVTETGRFHLIDSDLSQGSGMLNVSDTNDVNASFQFVTESGSTFADGTTSTICSLAGSLVERQSLIITVNCHNTAGLTREFSATLSSKIVYEGDSSLATIAGNYQGEKFVLDIAGDGMLFSQEAVSGCVINGQAGIIDSAFNAYDVEFVYSNCTGADMAMNGDSFVGIALLDDTVTPQALYLVAIGDTDGDDVSFEGNFVSFVETLARL